MKEKVTKNTKNSNIWFVKRHWSYIPITIYGWLTYIPFITFLLGSLMAVTENTNSIPGALFDVFPYWVSGVVIMHWLAGHKS